MKEILEPIIVNRQTYKHVVIIVKVHLSSTSPILHSTDTLAMFFLCRRRSYCVSACSLYTAIQRMTTGLHDHGFMVSTAYDCNGRHHRRICRWYVIVQYDERVKGVEAAGGRCASEEVCGVLND